jgi:CheY-like chemotaxis protein
VKELAMRSYRLLIVDDDVARRRLYRSLLKQAGSDVRDVQQAVNGAAGLVELRTGAYHCALLDFDLPDMTVFEFLTAASVDGQLPCAVVLVTEQGNEVADATRLGVHGYLAKDEANTTNLWHAVAQAVMKAGPEQRLAMRDHAAANVGLGQKIIRRQAVKGELSMGEQTDYAISPDGGNDFWYEVPAVAPASRPKPRPVKNDSSSAPRYRVLVVDDLVMNRSFIGALLGSAGHAVTEAEGGEEAVWLASENPFDLILMDIRMPEVDGLEATRRIRTLAGPHGQVPILALTAHTFLDQKAKCRDAGMDGHLAKPVDYDTLISAVHNVIAGSAHAARVAN